MFTRKQALILLIGVLALIVAFFSVLFFSRQSLIKITVVAIPHDAVITLDGGPIKEGSVYVEPGDHILRAERQYFSTVTKKINTDGLSGDVYLLPVPSTQAAIDWLSQHPQAQLEREAIGGVETQKAQDDLFNNPVTKKLPVYNFRYRIDYSITSGNKLKFMINLYPSGDRASDEYKQQLLQYKAEAFKFLKDNGADPSKYEVSVSPSD